MLRVGFLHPSVRQIPLTRAVTSLLDLPATTNTQSNSFPRDWLSSLTGTRWLSSKSDDDRNSSDRNSGNNNNNNRRPREHVDRDFGRDKLALFTAKRREENNLYSRQRQQRQENDKSGNGRTNYRKNYRHHNPRDSNNTRDIQADGRNNDGDYGGNNRRRNNNNNNYNNNRDGRNFRRRNSPGPDSRRPQDSKQQQQNSNPQQGLTDKQQLTEVLSRLRLSHRPTPSEGRDNNPGGRPSFGSGPPISSWREKYNRPSFSRNNNNNDDASSGPPPLPRFDASMSNRSRPNDRQHQNQHHRPHHGRNNQYRPNQPRPVERNELEFLMGGRRAQKLAKAKKAGVTNSSNDVDDEDVVRSVVLPGNGTGLTLAETSALFRVKMDDIRKQLVSMGVISSVYSTEESDDQDSSKPKKAEVVLDVETLELLAMEYGIETERGEDDMVVDHAELLLSQRRAEDVVATLPPRPPVVCIMGHVDHGKTTLMDALRRISMEQQNPKAKKSKGKGKKKKNEPVSKNVAGTEAGGITQIISAFQVDLEGHDSKITFLDTPGHAAFKSMRQSGSHAADVIVLVVAADDGVSEQTVEILNFYKSIVTGSEGGISMVIAMNKIDKPGVDVDEAQRRIENQLLEHGILCEGMSGDSEFGPPVQIIPTSGLTGLGLDDLMEGLFLQSEIMDLRADDEALAEGIVMDARMEKGLGVVADCIIRWGSLRKGDVIVSGTQASKIRMLKDVNDKMLPKGLPSQPVRIVGFKNLPKAGDPIMCVESEEIAEEMVGQRLAMEASEEQPEVVNNDVELHISGMRSRDSRRAAKIHQLAGLDDSGEGAIRIPIIVKADADGSLSAVRDALVELGEQSSHNVLIDPIQEGIGEITPTDIQMAKESDACIFAFGLKRVNQATLNLAEAEGVMIRTDDIIYSLLDDAKLTLGKYLPPQPVEHFHGRAIVQAVFTVDTDAGKENIAGLKVTDGNIYKDKGPVNKTSVKTHFRVLRDGEQISPEGETVRASSLRRHKELVESVRHGDECGLGLAGFPDFMEGDEIECYSVEMQSGKL
eukprot:Nitzschia sp. Nitz4//scaffold287_size23745//13179//16401//NITZ4_008459-RA/size23745-snap-gene-0.25-mRNA-1//-1//CDS//3329545766//6325//frame0